MKTPTRLKTRLIAAGLFAATASAVALFPVARGVGVPPPAQTAPTVAPAASEAPRIEAMFVLDTTGSMGGLIHAAKEKIWSIATSLASAGQAPVIRMGLVAFRDRGDQYVTRVVDLSEDLDSMYADLMGLAASGGGDGPESVNRALHDAVHAVSWTQDPGAYKVIFLVGDAPPHMDYPDEARYPEILADARQRGIVINAIQAGQMQGTTGHWQRIAALGGGAYFHVEHGGSAVALSTPFDAELAELSAELDGTRLFYGSDAERAEMRGKVDATARLHAGASVESRARRATFNASKSGAANLLGDKELVDDVASGRVDLEAVAQAELPAPLAAMAPAERQAHIHETAARRVGLQGLIEKLTAKRKRYLQEKVEAAGGAKDSLDRQIFEAVREQAAPKGLAYEAGDITY